MTWTTHQLLKNMNGAFYHGLTYYTYNIIHNSIMLTFFIIFNNNTAEHESTFLVNKRRMFYGT